MFNLDVAFTIFYQIPPRLFSHELRVAMPCSLEAYMADTNGACYKAAMKKLKAGPHFLAEVISAFTENRMELYAEPGDFSLISLYSILFGKLWHVIVEHTHSNFGRLRAASKHLEVKTQRLQPRHTATPSRRPHTVESPMGCDGLRNDATTNPKVRLRQGCCY